MTVNGLIVGCMFLPEANGSWRREFWWHGLGVFKRATVEQAEQFNAVFQIMMVEAGSVIAKLESCSNVLGKAWSPSVIETIMAESERDLEREWSAYLGRTEAV